MPPASRQTRRFAVTSHCSVSTRRLGPGAPMFLFFGVLARRVLRRRRVAQSDARCVVHRGSPGSPPCPRLVKGARLRMSLAAVASHTRLLVCNLLVEKQKQVLP